MDKSHLLFLDTETTGIGPDDRLCQVAYKFAGVEKEAYTAAKKIKEFVLGKKK